MATNLEVQREQKRHLYSLLKIRKANKGVRVAALDGEINAAKAEMSKEDVAWVEKTIEEIEGE